MFLEFFNHVSILLEKWKQKKQQQLTKTLSLVLVNMFLLSLWKLIKNYFKKQDFSESPKQFREITLTWVFLV